MPYFGEGSLKQLATLDPDLQMVLKEAIKHVDFSVVCGHRNQQDQHAAFVSGLSEVDWPYSMHNKQPSLAVDVAPYVHGIKWNDVEGFTLLAGIIKGIALMMNVKLRIGVDWDGDNFVREHSFIDRPHIELA